MGIFDTIVALATPRQVSAIAVVRLSGPQSLSVLSHMIHRKVDTIDPNTAFFANVYRDKEKAETLLDQAVIVYFKGPRSYTGEDTVEFSLHGSPSVADAVMEACVRHGARPAQRGEFSMKAYANGKMTLLEAEAVNDFIHANSAQGRSLAMASIRGASSNYVAKIKAMLLEAIAESEYLLEDDLTDHKDYLEAMSKTADSKVIPVLEEAEKLLAYSHNGKRLYDGIEVAIVGKPNVGKSSLLNALIGQDKAIVTPIPGTTRDIVEGEREIDGVLFKFKDTAGLRETEDAVEKIGVQRSLRAIQTADVVLWVSDGSFDGLDETTLAALKGKNVIKVGSKGDLGHAQGAEVETCAIQNQVEALTKLLANRAGIAQKRVDSYLMSQRDMAFLDDLIADLKQALTALKRDGYLDAFSDMLQRGIESCNELLGESKGQTAEDVYQTIFSKFCLGK